MRVLVTLMAPLYWSFAHTGGDVPAGILLTRGTFRHESQVEFGTGEGCSACGSPGVTSPCEKGQGQRLLLPGFSIPVPHGHWGLSLLLSWARCRPAGSGAAFGVPCATPQPSHPRR